MDKVINDIKDQISENKVLLFMKGSPYQPQCGFSAKVAQILFSYDVEFSYIDVLEFPEVRENLPKISDQFFNQQHDFGKVLISNEN